MGHGFLDNSARVTGLKPRLRSLDVCSPDDGGKGHRMIDSANRRREIHADPVISAIELHPLRARHLSLGPPPCLRSDETSLGFRPLLNELRGTTGRRDVSA